MVVSVRLKAIVTDSIIFENGKGSLHPPAGEEIGRSNFVYNPATKAWNYFDKGNRVTGRQYIDGHLILQGRWYSQAKGENYQGKRH